MNCHFTKKGEKCYVVRVTFVPFKDARTDFEKETLNELLTYFWQLEGYRNPCYNKKYSFSLNFKNPKENSCGNIGELTPFIFF